MYEQNHLSGENASLRKSKPEKTSGCIQAMLGNQASLTVIQSSACQGAAVLQDPVIQRVLDRVDLDAIRQLGTAIPNFEPIIDRLMAIYENYPQGIGYGDSDTGGEATLNAQGTPRVIINDRAAFGHRGFTGAGALNTADVDRQSKIIHELTHEEIIRVNAGGFGPHAGVNAEPHGIDDAASEAALLDVMHDVENLRQAGIFPNTLVKGMNLLDYMEHRLQYAVSIAPIEFPSVANELIYLLNVLPHSQGQAQQAEQWQAVAASPLLGHLQELSQLTFGAPTAGTASMGPPPPKLLKRIWNWITAWF